MTDRSAFPTPTNPLRPVSNAFAILGIAASILGLIFAILSSVDYARHLDRHLHDVHCSLVPGLSNRADDEENPCRAAMYSAYAAVFRGAIWGGVPISLFAVGAFSFFVGFLIYLFVAGRSAPKTALGFFAALGLTPLMVSVAMFVISLTKLGALCKTCVGIYLSSTFLAVAAILALRALLRSGPDKPTGSWFWPPVWVGALLVCTLVPSLVYASSVPDERPFLTQCGKLQKTTESHNALIKMKTPQSVRPAILFEDPLCPTCRAFHQRMVAEGAFDRLDIELALLPVDSECNWMLTTPLHPGACTVSKAIICAGDRARDVLEWAYEEQDDLVKAAKAGDPTLRTALSQRWGNDIVRCLDATSTKLKLNQQLHFAADNAIPVSTPQMYLGDQRVCDEDTDLGLRYTLAQLAPEVVR
ncbi:MAG TPA: vitamin K epoxide reductase family protein [Polyangiaceae bacterium]